MGEVSGPLGKPPGEMPKIPSGGDVPRYEVSLPKNSGIEKSKSLSKEQKNKVNENLKNIPIGLKANILRFLGL